MKHPIRLRFLLCVCILIAGRAYAQNGICPDTIDVTNTFYSAYDFVIPGVDEGMPVQWNFGDGTELMDDDSVDHAFMAGNYIVSAIFMDGDCLWDGPTVLQVMLEVSQCGITLTYVEQEGGLFTVTATGGPEEYPMHWDMGDGSTIEETWVVDHIYEPGTFNVCSWYYTELCPDTVNACVELIYDPVDTCNSVFNFSYSNVTNYLFEAEEFQFETNYFWDFGDGYMQGPRDTLVDMSGLGLADSVCLVVSNGTCVDTTCREVYLCYEDIFWFEFEGYYSFNGSDIIVPFMPWPLFQNEGDDRDGVGSEFEDPFVLDSVNSKYKYVYCGAGACFPLSLDLPSPQVLDSLRMTVYYSYDHLLLTDTVFSSDYYNTLSADPDCRLSDVRRVKEFAISAYPNPASNVLHLLATQSRVIHYFGVDTFGENGFNGSTSNQITDIDVSTLPDGLYTLMCVSSDASKSQSFIVSH